MRYTVLGDPVLTAGSGHDGQHNQDYLDTTYSHAVDDEKRY